VLALELQQLADKEVVVGVGNLGAVERVVPLVVVGDLPTEIRNVGSKLGGLGHGRECKELGAE
jgi:hypothetical protein